MGDSILKTSWIFQKSVPKNLSPLDFIEKKVEILMEELAAEEEGEVTKDYTDR